VRNYNNKNPNIGALGLPVRSHRGVVLFRAAQQVLLLNRLHLQPALGVVGRKGLMMFKFLKGTTIGLTLVAVVLGTSAPASARIHHKGNSAVSFSIGNVAFGYRDGYRDNGHTWHKWRNNSDYRSYRDHHGSSYHNWNHTRDANNGWQR
jgi:hypothetical protein